MAEINEFISPKAKKEIDGYLKKIGQIATQYAKITKASLGFEKQLKAEAQTETVLIKNKRELEKLAQDKLNTDAKLLRNEVALTKAVENEARAIQKKNTALKNSQSAYSQLSKKLNDSRKKAKDAAVTYGLLSKQFRTATKDVVKLDTQLKKIDAKLGQSQRFVGQYSRAWGGVSRVLGAFGFTGVLFTVVNAIKNGISGIREFGKQNAILAGVLGKTRKDITVLTKDAKRLGRDTAKTASEVNGLQIAYARLGFTQAEILDLTEDTINGSIALNAELADTADLTGAVIKTFDDLKTTDADLVLDQLTLSTQRSALNFEKLQTAIPITAGAAAAAKVPFSTMIAQLGQAADRGIDASTSATSLRNIYLELSKQGITLEQALTKINTSQDKLSTANELFGKRAAVTALALANTTDKTKELDTALQDAGGTAERVANEQLNTLDGRITLLSSAYDGFVKSLDKGETALSQFVQTGISEMTKFFNFLSSNGDEFDEGLFTKDMASNSEANLKRFKETFERDADLIKSKYKGSELEIVASANTIWRRLALTATTEGIANRYGEIKKASDDLIEINTKLKIINDLLADSQKEVNEKTEDNTVIVSDNASVKKDLIKVNREEVGVKVEWIEQEEKRDKILVSAEEGAKKLAQTGIEASLARQQQEATNLEQQIIFDQIRKESGINSALSIATAASNLLGQQTVAGKIAAVTEATISGYLGAQKAFTETPGPIFVKAAAAAAAGSFAIKNIRQILTVDTSVPPIQTVPAFAKGTDSTPSGTWLAGEKGRELKVDRGGNVSLIDSPTLFTNEIGSKIIKNSDTERILRGDKAAISNNFNDAGIIQAIQNNKPMVNIDKRGVFVISRKGQGTTKYINDRYRN